MAEKMTLEQVRDWHYETAREKDQTGELRFPGPNESPFYRFPSEQSKLHDAMADAIDAQLAQPAQSVDVVLVPREPTDAMLKAGVAVPLYGQFYPGHTAEESEYVNEQYHAAERRGQIYKAMLTAALTEKGNG